MLFVILAIIFSSLLLGWAAINSAIAYTTLRSYRAKPKTKQFFLWQMNGVFGIITAAVSLFGLLYLTSQGLETQADALIRKNITQIVGAKVFIDASLIIIGALTMLVLSKIFKAHTLRLHAYGLSLVIQSCAVLVMSASFFIVFLLIYGSAI